MATAAFIIYIHKNEFYWSNIGTLILIQISLIVLWETTSVLITRMGLLESNYIIVFLIILSVFSYVLLEKNKNKIHK